LLVPSLLFILFGYLLLNSCDRNDVKHRVFLFRLLPVGGSEKSQLCCVLALKSVGVRLADVQSEVIVC